MAKIEIDVHVAWTKWHHENEGNFSASSGLVSSYADESWVKLHVGTVPIELEYELPSENEMAAFIVKHLRQKKQQILADAQQEANSVDQLIQNFLAIEDRTNSEIEEV